jgi:tetratricopeptide (TPR) repeat protein
MHAIARLLFGLKTIGCLLLPQWVLASTSESDAENIAPHGTLPVLATKNLTPVASEPPLPSRETFSIQARSSQLAIEPTVRIAYQALLRGHYDDAEAAYEQTLKNDPWNRDALYGMTTLHLRQQHSELAEFFCRRILEADPKDTFALGTLIGLQSPIDPQGAEYRINTLLETAPTSPFLSFSLGNLLASQGRWREAQQAYFKAVHRTPGNPDYLFNLAVSLDHLEQRSMAIRYYEQALDAAARLPAAFAPNSVSKRLKKLRP